MNEYVAGATSVVDLIYLLDSSSTSGGGKTGLVFNTAGLTCYYKRSNGTASVSVTLATIATFGTYTSGGFKEIDATNMPGAYEFHPPDAAFAAGAKEVTFFFTGASGMVPRPIKYRILTVNPDSATAFITGVNSLAPPTNWNLQSIDSNGRLDVVKIFGTALSASAGAGLKVAGEAYDVNAYFGANAVAWKGTTLAAPDTAGYPKVTVKSGTATGEVNLSGGNLAGSVASVVGAVGSVTGNVGGNVVGSVGSLSGITFPSNFGVLAISGSGSVNVASTAGVSWTANSITGLVAAGTYYQANSQLPDSSGVTTLLSRLTVARAGYLDNLASAIPTAAGIADQVWDELLSGHTTTGSAGKALSDASTTENDDVNVETEDINVVIT